MMPCTAAACGLTGTTGPSKPPCVRLRISAAPTECGRSDAPITATDRGRNIRSRLRIDMTCASSLHGQSSTPMPAMTHRSRVRVSLHVARHAIDLILELPARALEGVVERECEIGMTLVRLGRARDVDLA